jgi:hypothetical protein
MLCPVIIRMQLPTIKCNTIIGIMAAQFLVKFSYKHRYGKLLPIELDPITQSLQSQIQFLTACFAFQNRFPFSAYTHVMGKA